MTPKRPAIDGADRLDRARMRRMKLAVDAHEPTNHPPLKVLANTDNTLSQRPMAFMKGLLHGPDGAVAPKDIDTLRDALCGTTSGPSEVDPAFDVPHASLSYQPKFARKGQTTAGFRKFESPLTGLYYDNQGLDIASVAMHAAPTLGTSELVAEMAELYVMALVRDMSFDELDEPTAEIYRIDPVSGSKAFHKYKGRKVKVQDLLDALNSLSWFRTRSAPDNPAPAVDAPYALARWAKTPHLSKLFRGSTPGSKEGGYISQFMLLGSPPRADGCNVDKALDGLINFGTNRIDQRVDINLAGLDYMTSFEEWREVQNGVDLGMTDRWGDPRFLKTPRDLAAYVHFDQLYQAYFNACLLLLGTANCDAAGTRKVDFDPGMPETNAPHRSGFASFGGPHVLSMLTEVATRGLRAVRRQKFQIHLRGRPERLAALISLHANGQTGAIGADAVDKVAAMAKELGLVDENPFTKVMSMIDDLNKAQNDPGVVALRGYERIREAESHDHDAGGKIYLLPMAFPEGSPMHASYGAGHATVAGACVTVLKAFFELEGRTIKDTFGIGAKVDSKGGLAKDPAAEALTLSGELDKLAANISIGRNMAGVHYYSDYFDSLRMGERVAVGVIMDQLRAYTEAVCMSFTSFDGDKVTLSTQGRGCAMLKVDGSTPAEWWHRHYHNTLPTPLSGASGPLVASSNWDTPSKAG